MLTLFQTKNLLFLVSVGDGQMYHISREIRGEIFPRYFSVKKAEWVRADIGKIRNPPLGEREKSRQSLRTKSINQPLTCSEREQSWYSERGFHIDMYCNCFFYVTDTIAEVKLLIFCADILIYEINFWVFKQFQFICNNVYIINNKFTFSLKKLFAVIEEIFNNLGQQF